MNAFLLLVPLLTIGGSLSQAAMEIWYAVFAIGFTILLSIGLLFGGHDGDSHDGGADHDAGHDGDGDSHEGGADSLSIFSIKTVFWFGAGLGVGGFFAAFAGLQFIWTIAIGAVTGLVIAAIGYSIMNYLYRRQYSDTIRVQDAIGKVGVVETTINPGGAGSISVLLGSGQQSFNAKTTGEVTLHVGSSARISAVMGGTLIVEAITPTT